MRSLSPTRPARRRAGFADRHAADRARPPPGDASSRACVSRQYRQRRPQHLDALRRDRDDPANACPPRRRRSAPARGDSSGFQRRRERRAVHWRGTARAGRSSAAAGGSAPSASENWPLVSPSGRRALSNIRASARAARCACRHRQVVATCRTMSDSRRSPVDRSHDRLISTYLTLGQRPGVDGFAGRRVNGGMSSHGAPGTDGPYLLVVRWRLVTTLAAFYVTLLPDSRHRRASQSETASR